MDTAARRRSALGAVLFPAVPVLNPPLPDGDIDAEDRSTLAGVYGGLDYTVIAPAPVVAEPTYVIWAHDGAGGTGWAHDGAGVVTWAHDGAGWVVWP